MRRPPERRVRLADVARLAETSEATASRALKDDPRIGEGTRAAVRAAAHKLGYVPNAAARSLRAKRTHILGLLLDDLADPVHGKVAAGFEEAAASRGYAVFMMTGLHDADREERALRTFLEHRADGVVLASCVSEPSDVFRYVSQERVVFVQPDYPSLADGAEPPDHGVLRSDDVGGFSAAIEHVVEQGYRRIAYVGPGIGASDAVRRAAAAETLERLGLGTMRFVDSGPNGWRDPSVAAEQLASDPPDAVVCYDDKLAMALLDALRSTQLDVPGEIGFMGFDGIPAARQSRPRLTTVDVPSVEIGRRAVEMLVDSTREGKPRPSEVLPVRLIVGETTPRVRRKSDAGGHATDAAALAAPGEVGR
ncbi:MAG TPA: LacI family DNA-binding transcriptional regulator [Candidatus Limnocylindrales bacterium]